MTRTGALGLVLLCLGLVLPCPAAAGAPTGSPNGGGVSAVDDSGRTLTLAAPARRVVSLAPHATELLAAAGATARLVAVDRWSDTPAAVRDLPRVGDAFGVNVEAVLALQPDLVVAWASALRPEVRASLEQFGIPVFVSEPRSLVGILEQVAVLARLTGGQPDTGALQRRLNALTPAVPPVRVAVLVAREPLLGVSAAHYLDDLLRRCGGVNPFADSAALVPRLSVEALLAARLDVVLVPVAEEGDRQRWQRSLGPVLAQATLLAVPADLLARPGPRLLRAAELVCAGLASGAP